MPRGILGLPVHPTDSCRRFLWVTPSLTDPASEVASSSANQDLDMEDNLLSSDTDDLDYVPPDSGKAGASSSGAPALAESDSDSADAFYAEDAVPEYADSDMDRPPYRPGGPSSAGPSRAGGSSGAGSSSRPGGSSGAGASSSAAPRPPTAGASSSNGSKSDAVNGTEITPAAAAKDVPVANKEPAADKEIGTEKSASKETTNSKTTVDDLWREMNKPIAKTAAVKSSKEVASGLGDWLKEPTVTKAAISKVPRLEEIASKREAEEADEIQPVKKQKLGTGLEAVLSAAKGEQKSSTLEKTKESWKEFKKDDKEVEEELEAYKKDKNRYTDKVSFLERSSQREWEVEQAGKKRR